MAVVAGLLPPGQGATFFAVAVYALLKELSRAYSAVFYGCRRVALAIGPFASHLAILAVGVGSRSPPAPAWAALPAPISSLASGWSVALRCWRGSSAPCGPASMRGDGWSPYPCRCSASACSPRSSCASTPLLLGLLRPFEDVAPSTRRAPPVRGLAVDRPTHPPGVLADRGRPCPPALLPGPAPVSDPPDGSGLLAGTATALVAAVVADHAILIVYGGDVRRGGRRLRIHFAATPFVFAGAVALFHLTAMRRARAPRWCAAICHVAQHRARTVAHPVRRCFRCRHGDPGGRAADGRSLLTLALAHAGHACRYGRAPPRSRELWRSQDLGPRRLGEDGRGRYVAVMNRWSHFLALAAVAARGRGRGARRGTWAGCSGTALPPPLPPTSRYWVERHLAHAADPRERLDVYVPVGADRRQRRCSSSSVAVIGNAAPKRTTPSWGRPSPRAATSRRSRTTGFTPGPLSGLPAGRGRGDRLARRESAGRERATRVPRRSLGRRLYRGDAGAGPALAGRGGTRPVLQSRRRSGWRTLRLPAARRCDARGDLRARPRWGGRAAHRYVAPGSPPMLLATGQDDRIVRPANSRTLARGAGMRRCGRSWWSMPASAMSRWGGAGRTAALSGADAGRCRRVPAARGASWCGGIAC